MPARIAVAYKFGRFTATLHYCRGLLVSCALWNCFPAYANTQILLAPCELKKDPDISLPPMAVCLEGFAGTWIPQRSHLDGPIQPPTLFSSSGKLTTLFSKWLVIQAEGHSRIYKERQTYKILNKDVAPDKLLLQIGNSSISRHRIMVGRSTPPFGLGLNLDSKWSNFETTGKFYGRPIRLAGYTYDNQKDITWTVSAGAKNERDVEASERSLAISTRLAYDFAALEGSRIVASFSTTELADRAGSLGVLNVNGKGDRTSLEVVRTWTQFPYDPQDFQQLIRINWRGKTGESFTTGVQFEDIWGEYRLGTVGIEKTWVEHLSTSLTLGYQKSETNLNSEEHRRSYWLAVAGCEVSL